MSAWIEYRLNLTDHFMADSCGKVAALLGNFIFMSAALEPSAWPNITREKYFDKNYLPTIRRNTDLESEILQYKKWHQHYCSSFFETALQAKMNEISENINTFSCKKI